MWWTQGDEKEKQKDEGEGGRETRGLAPAREGERSYNERNGAL